MVEGRSAAKGNAEQAPAPRTQSRTSCASMGLEGVRQAARRNRRLRFTALMHHITPQLLVDSFYSLQRNAAAGVDGVTWREYEKILPQRVTELHRMIHAGAYRATPSRRVYIPKADGRQRPLGIASIEDKIVQQAVVTVLSAIYEEDFLGFSYGFRPGRGQHDALDALTAGIKSRKVNWIVDADIRSFFDEIDHGWMLRFLEHRIADQRIIRLDPQMARSGSDRRRKADPCANGDSARGGGFATAGEYLPALRLRSLGSALAETARARRGHRASLCRRQCGGLRECEDGASVSGGTAGTAGQVRTDSASR